LVPSSSTPTGTSNNNICWVDIVIYLLPAG
jgi:hypothetical protein